MFRICLHDFTRFIKPTSSLTISAMNNLDAYQCRHLNSILLFYLDNFNVTFMCPLENMKVIIKQGHRDVRRK
jgi:hypothetical protein